MTGEFSKFTDAFSFGITLWEFANHGKKPYENQDGAAVRDKVLHDGMRPPVDPDLDLIFKVLMSWCWDTDPERRPSMCHVWAILDGYWRALANTDPNVNEPDWVLQHIMAWCDTKDQEQPSFQQVSALLEHFMAWKTGKFPKVPGHLGSLRRKHKPCKQNVPQSVDRDNYGVALETELLNQKKEKGKEKGSRGR